MPVYYNSAFGSPTFWRHFAAAAERGMFRALRHYMTAVPQSRPLSSVGVKPPISGRRAAASRRCSPSSLAHFASFDLTPISAWPARYGRAIHPEC